MIGTLYSTTGASSHEDFEICEFTELVRGNDQLLFEHLLPQVRRHSVSLDLHAVTRIDAAGLAALIKLYCAAHEADHEFSVLNPSPHVAEILALVGLERLLSTRKSDDITFAGPELEATAA